MKNIMIIVLCLFSVTLYAQEHETEDAFTPHHSISLLLGHTNTDQGSEDGKKKWLTLPSWALDYDYIFSRKWSVGLHNDIILETFKVEDHETHSEIIERTRPFASLAVVKFKPGEHFYFELGAGGEFAKEGSYFLNRMGIEYALEMHNNWEFISSLAYDIKWQAYNSLSISAGVGKLFGFRKHK